MSNSPPKLIHPVRKSKSSVQTERHVHSNIFAGVAVQRSRNSLMNTCSKKAVDSPSSGSSKNQEMSHNLGGDPNVALPRGMRPIIARS